MSLYSKKKFLVLHIFNVKIICTIHKIKTKTIILLNRKFIKLLINQKKNNVFIFKTDNKLLIPYRIQRYYGSYDKSSF